jgi:hypothetical protein
VSDERPRIGSVIAFSIGSLEITAVVLAVVGVVVALLTVVQAEVVDALVVLSVPVFEASLPALAHRFVPGSAHLVRVLACVMMLTWVGLSLGTVGYLFVPTVATMIVVAVWSGRQRREALRQAILTEQRRQRRVGRRSRRKRPTP